MEIRQFLRPPTKKLFLLVMRSDAVVVDDIVVTKEAQDEEFTGHCW